MSKTDTHVNGMVGNDEFYNWDQKKLPDDNNNMVL